MSDGKTYFYETEVEWTGAKDLKLSGAKQPAITAGAPPEFQGREENDCDRGILESRSR
ncbi:MAG: hypothetical protein K0Q83_3727 [Deltaproteobacteria bacterium]|nr:hypothetical protein [Deltaproteobacteria bacterium]